MIIYLIKMSLFRPPTSSILTYMAPVLNESDTPALL